jgi:CRP-like cAMP-binding protein
MPNHRPMRTVSSPDLAEAAGSDLPLDHALALLLADETENALRWGAAVLESGPWTPSALVVTARLLDQMGRRRAAIEGLQLAVQQATAEGNLPLAMAALGDLRALGADVEQPLDKISSAFCQGSNRLQDSQVKPLLPQLGEFRPLSPFLTGPALASKAAQIVESVRRTEGEVEDVAPQQVAPLPLFSSLEKEALHDLLAAFETLTVPAGHAVIREGEEEAAAYIVARGELEVSRRSNDEEGKPLVMARLGTGSFFGEMALLSQLPGAASVIATRPTILLVARREALEAVVEKHPDVAVELAAHCRRQSVANLGWASPVVVAIPPEARATLVEHFETRIFEAGDKLVEKGDEARGLHLIVSGEIAVVAHEKGERVVLATLTAGETVGEVELVLCRNAGADATAVRPTATLFLPREEFFALAQNHPAILHGLYAIAVRRHAETKLALEAGSAVMADESFVDGFADADANADAGATHEDPVTLVETVSSRLDDTERPAQVRPRMTPLARGTLALPRVTNPPRVSSSRPTPSVSPGPRNTLPMPPPLPRTPAPSPVTTGRIVLPPPIPGTPNPPATAAGGSTTMRPLAASIASEPASSRASRAQTIGVVVLTAAAAAAIVFATMREDHGNGPSAAAPPVPTEIPSASASVASNALPTPATTWTVVETPARPATVAPKPKASPAAHAPKTTAAAPAHVSTATLAASVAATAETSAPPAPARPEAVATKPAVTEPAPTTGEFGGRE